MAPCRGCRDKVDGITGNFKMRFIGKPGGKLMKGAPGNYEHGKEYVVPYSWSKFNFWELLEPIPEVKIPEPTEKDSVYEGGYFPPEKEEEEERVELNEPSSAVLGIVTEKQYQENLRKLQSGNYSVGKDGLIEYEKKEPTRKELMKTLDDAGIEYNNRTRTYNLKKMVDELDKVQE